MTFTAGVGKKALLAALAFSLALGVAGCGVKNDLVMPDGKPTPKGEKDPSKPPTPQQQGL
ncbi:MAG: lipoprotein [Rhizomicrobium sp.]